MIRFFKTKAPLHSQIDMNNRGFNKCKSDKTARQTLMNKITYADSMIPVWLDDIKFWKKQIDEAQEQINLYRDLKKDCQEVLKALSKTTKTE